MGQYTLLIMGQDKVVHMKGFISKESLLNAKRYGIEKLKNVELQQVDRDGYVWFAELPEEDQE